MKREENGDTTDDHIDLALDGQQSFVSLTSNFSFIGADSYTSIFKQSTENLPKGTSTNDVRQFLMIFDLLLTIFNLHHPIFGSHFEPTYPKIDGQRNLTNPNREVQRRKRKRTRKKKLSFAAFPQVYCTTKLESKTQESITDTLGHFSSKHHLLLTYLKCGNLKSTQNHKLGIL
jgi:hypothetical protein